MIKKTLTLIAALADGEGPAGHPGRDLRTVLRTPRKVHLRRYLGGQGLLHPERERVPHGRAGGLQGPESARAALAGRLLRRRIPLDGRHRPAGEPQEAREQQLGQHGGGQLLRHPRVPEPLRDAGHRTLHQRQRGFRHRRGAGQVGRIHDRQGRVDGRAPRQERPQGALEGQVPGRRQRKLGLRRRHDR